MSARPTTIRLQGVTWQIRAMTGAELFTESKGGDLLGCCEHAKAELQIRNDMPPGRERQILWHELYHAVENDCGLEFTEEQVRVMAAGLFAILRDNPAFAQWLLEEA